MDVFADKTSNLGEIIAKNRKALGWTQERLAKYLGITKASISKWETGQSYPHIMLLPELATLFDMSIDELLSYESKLSNREIERITKHLVSVREAEGVVPSLERLDYYLRRHGNCPEFLSNAITFLIFTAILSETKKTREQCFDLALELIQDIQRLSTDPKLILAARGREATIELFRGEFDKVIAKGEQSLAINGHFLQISFLEALRDGKKYERLEEVSQILLLRHVQAVLSILTIYMSIPNLDFSRFETLFKAGSDLGKTLDLETVPDTGIFGFIAQAAMNYSRFEQNDYALRLLETYVQKLQQLPKPLTVDKHRIFGQLQRHAEDFRFTNELAAVGDNTFHHFLAKLILTNPNLEAVRAEPEFPELAAILKRMLSQDLQE